jgi:hypothetical protein
MTDETNYAEGRRKLDAYRAKLASKTKANINQVYANLDASLKEIERKKQEGLAEIGENITQNFRDLARKLNK